MIIYLSSSIWKVQVVRYGSKVFYLEPGATAYVEGARVGSCHRSSRSGQPLIGRLTRDGYITEVNIADLEV